jgi:DNA polymerase-3 subunit delta
MVAAMRPFTLVTSDDALLLQRGVDRALKDLPEGVDVERADVEEEGLPDVRTASLFGGFTVHLLRFSKVPSGGIYDELLSLAGASDGDTATVVAIKHGTPALPASLKKVADAAGAGAHIAMSRPPDWADEQWDRLVGDEFRVHGRNADASAIVAVRGYAGLDPSTIAVQVASVCAAAPGDKTRTLGEADVDSVLEGHGRQSGFAVADAIVAHDVAAAVIATRGALAGGDEPLALLGAIAYRLRQLLVLRGGGSGQAAGLGRRPVNGGRLRSLTAEAKQQFGPGELAWAVDRLARLDHDLKGSDLPSDLLLEVAVIELASGTTVDPLRPTHTRRPFPTSV